MRKTRFYLRFLWALVTKYYLAIICGLIIGAITFAYLPRFLVFLPRIRSTNSIAIVGQYSLSQLPSPLHQKITSGLTAVDESGRAQSAIAASWEATDSGKKFIFTLHDQLNWQNGSRLKSSDIKFQFKDIKVSYPDDLHLIIELKDPFAPLPVVVSQPLYKSSTLGTGSYSISKISRNGFFLNYLILSPLDHKSSLPRLRYQFYPTESQARTAYKLGLVQSIFDISDPQELTQWPHTQVTPITHFDRYVAVLFNTQDNYFSGTAGKNLRQSMAYAIDKSRWPNRASGPINPLSWSYTEDVKKYEYDLVHAKELLEKVEKLPSKINLVTVPAYLAVAESIKSDWQKLGLTADISVSPEIPEDFSVLVIAQAIPIDPDQYNLWHSTQGSNLTRIKNPRIDKLLEDGRKTLDPKTRQDIYRDFQKYLVEESPAVFLFHPVTYAVTRN